MPVVSSDRGVATRFLHTADLQLGMTRHFLSADAQSRYSEARLEAVRAIGRLAAEERCAFVVVAGDVFETNQVARSVVLPALEAMGECPVPVLLLPGNHDAWHAGSVYRTRTFRAALPHNVTVLEPGTVREIEGVTVVPAAFETKKPDVNPIEAVCRGLAPCAGPRVLVGHGIVDAVNPQSVEPSVIPLALLEQVVRERLVDYIALGDQHSAGAVGTTGRIFYAGTPLVTSYREERPNRALVVELHDDTVEVTEHVVGEWQFIEHRFYLSGDADVEEVDTWLSELTERRRSVVRVSFVGTISLGARAQLDEVLDRHREVLGALEIHERECDLAVLPDEGDLALLGLTGFARLALDDLVAASSSEVAERAEAARDALGLLYRLCQVDR